ncbi:hypothetical protein A3I25_01505 [Candidatus Nomurabacteria bacterium RIFCSPLOWO2_02_FULL_42_17]|uniref:Methyltransferase domain-containing protein n=2 Tax=Candidatus Nomuraibacteriota TaxID=1752729 RepID=A0A1F6WLC4_9BACT|nr:MAG: hypothetical protein UV08_C0034G0002 [Parcubacteria group bacterium GW2011_GWA2_42_18]OGI82712.1 MAG: hypothetical protein A3B93_01025 [Candidatus Nomurabacteria bacterium RIFCSPHIGHO2_02_FULL_42_24]OGI97446.1 MAG: hypothetical protein A3I25_01505 [Candidatus Nomurabacteria bacterium RIFCSPLOWO2_02_FULL_42_17]
MFSDPEKNIKQFDLREGQHVADLGAGSGACALVAARAVGSQGKVYALEVQRELLSGIKDEAARAKLFNVEVIWADIEKVNGTKLRNYAVDAVIVSNVLFQIEDRGNFIKEIKRILKPGGRVLIVDWSDSFGGLGPQSSAVVPPEKARALFEGAGFKFEQVIDAGAHHYGIIMSKV